MREYLRQHPEIVIEAIRAFQAKEEQANKNRAQASLVSRRDELVNDPTSPVSGNPDGDVTIVEFFDYRCGFCKKVFPIVMALLKKDRNIRYVFKEFPILGPESVVASRAALAAWRLDKDKYLDFHVGLMETRGSLPESKVMTLAAKSGYDVEGLRAGMADPEIEEILKRNLQLADSLNINGHPLIRHREPTDSRRRLGRGPEQSGGRCPRGMPQDRRLLRSYLTGSRENR